MEAIVAVCRGGSLHGGIRRVVGPRLGVADCRRGGGEASLRLGRVAGHLHVHPLLGHGHVVASVPLRLARQIGGAVADVSVGRHAVDWGLGVSVGERGVVRGLDLGQASVCDGRVGLGELGRLDRSFGLLGSSFGLEERGGVGDSEGLDVGI